METGCPHASYAILTKTKKGWDFEHVRVVYDWEKAAKRAEINSRKDWAQWKNKLSTPLRICDRSDQKCIQMLYPFGKGHVILGIRKYGIGDVKYPGCQDGIGEYQRKDQRTFEHVIQDILFFPFPNECHFFLPHIFSRVI